MSKSIWRILLIIAGALMLWTVGSALFPLWNYVRLNALVPAKIENWEIQKVGSEYALIAFFSYEVKGRIYKNQTTFQKPYYLNRYSAEEAVKNAKQKQWQAWVNSENPQISSLERPFPFLKILYSVMTIGVLLYFLYLYFDNKTL